MFAPRTGLRRGAAALSSALPAAFAIAALIAAWEAYARLGGVAPTTLPAPSRVFSQTIENRESLGTHALATLSATGLGFSLSLAAAFVLSVLVDFSAVMRRALLPVFIISQTLPMVAIAPLVVLWFGFGLAPKILLVALVTFFPMLVAWIEGYESTDPEITALLASMRASRRRIFVMARLPSALPYFFAGLRIAITYAVVGAIFAEYAGAARGLGIYILNAKNNFRPDLVLAAVLVSATLTLVLFGSTLLVQRVAMPWARLEKRAKP
ncbi:ABC transporter permease [Devosia pacifica]|uniref:ABC transporter permease n=1 Tax=Devosia pacifica TaxID=1335967 RepID=A0A918S5Z7_9HYPH|nr:ABC transporter permease [Devosia pacifica]GHA26276.1 ABC transporter permease [Devosia pacifica]